MLHFHAAMMPPRFAAIITPYADCCRYRFHLRAMPRYMMLYCCHVAATPYGFSLIIAMSLLRYYAAAYYFDAAITPRHAIFDFRFAVYVFRYAPYHAV